MKRGDVFTPPQVTGKPRAKNQPRWSSEIGFW